MGIYPSLLFLATSFFYLPFLPLFSSLFLLLITTFSVAEFKIPIEVHFAGKTLLLCFIFCSNTSGCATASSQPATLLLNLNGFNVLNHSSSFPLLLLLLMMKLAMKVKKYRREMRSTRTEWHFYLHW